MKAVLEALVAVLRSADPDRLLDLELSVVRYRETYPRSYRAVRRFPAVRKILEIFAVATDYGPENGPETFPLIEGYSVLRDGAGAVLSRNGEEVARIRRTAGAPEGFPYGFFLAGVEDGPEGYFRNPEEAVRNVVYGEEVPEPEGSVNGPVPPSREEAPDPSPENVREEARRDLAGLREFAPESGPRPGRGTP